MIDRDWTDRRNLYLSSASLGLWGYLLNFNAFFFGGADESDFNTIWRQKIITVPHVRAHARSVLNLFSSVAITLKVDISLIMMK